MSAAESQLDEMVAERVRLDKRRRELEAELEGISVACKALDGPILDIFADKQVQRMTVAGMTVYARTDRFVNKRKDVATADMLDALRKAGLGDLCSETYQAAAVKSRVLEWLDAGEPVPRELADCLNVSEVPKLVVLAS